MRSTGLRKKNLKKVSLFRRRVEQVAVYLNIKQTNTHIMQRSPISFAQSVANTAKDYARDYGMNTKDMVWDVVKEYGCDLGWSDSDRNDVYSAALKLV